MFKSKIFYFVFLVHVTLVVSSRVILTESYDNQIDIVILPLFYLDAPIAVIWYYLQILLVDNNNLGGLYGVAFTYSFFLIFGTWMWYLIVSYIRQRRATLT